MYVLTCLRPLCFLFNVVSQPETIVIVHSPTWWVITGVINGISRVNPLLTGVITYLLSGMTHQVVISHHQKK